MSGGKAVHSKKIMSYLVKGGVQNARKRLLNQNKEGRDKTIVWAVE
jgi:hypothetical protein